MKIYILITKNDGSKIVSNIIGQDKTQIDAMCKSLHPNSSYKEIKESEFNDFLELKRIKYAI